MGGWESERLPGGLSLGKPLASELFQKAFRASPDAIVIYRIADQLILDVNEAWEGVTGFRREEVLGRSQAELDIWSGEDAVRVKALLERDGFLRNYEFAFKKRGCDRTHYALLSAEPVEIDGHACMIGVGREITDRKEMEEQLSQARKLGALGRLAGGIAHDFNNLLTVILSACELIAPDPTNAEELSAMRAATMRAAALTRQLLSLSRHQSVHSQLVQVNELVRETVQMLGPLIGEHVRVLTSFAEGEPRVRMVRSELSQIVMNLALNARDAMPGGGDLRIETRVSGDEAILLVADTGQGMSDETLAHVFEPFFTTKGDNGTGIGLATVHAICERAGGRVEVSSRPGEGATFRVHLPLSREAPPAEASPARAQRVAHVPAAILLVEDQALVRQMLRRALESEGHTVTEASDAASAVTALERLAPSLDLLVCDVVLPGTSGVVVAKELRRLRPDVPVLFITGYLGQEGEELLELGEVLEKPFSREALVSAVRRQMAGEG